jgi:hypothetical protein
MARPKLDWSVPGRAWHAARASTRKAVSGLPASAGDRVHAVGWPRRPSSCLPGNRVMVVVGRWSSMVVVVVVAAPRRAGNRVMVT